MAALSLARYNPIETPLEPECPTSMVLSGDLSACLFSPDSLGNYRFSDTYWIQAAMQCESFMLGTVSRPANGIRQGDERSLLANAWAQRNHQRLTPQLKNPMAIFSGAFHTNACK
eukprot:scaffold367658_cov16-Prasinocladus_malaysianus.AAC.1